MRIASLAWKSEDVTVLDIDWIQTMASRNEKRPIAGVIL